MSSLIMNETAGRKLYELCLPYMNMSNGMDFADFIEEIGIPTYRLEQYFNGQRTVSTEDISRFAYVCRSSVEELTACLQAAFAEQAVKMEEEKQREEMLQQWKVDRQQKEEARQKVAAKRAEILSELESYGIKDIYTDSKLYPIENYYLVKFAMRYIWDEAYLPKLAMLIENCSDGNLVYEGEHALCWAADSKLSFQILQLLMSRKEWMQKHAGKPADNGRTALHHYVSSNSANPDGIDLLVDLGADVNAKDNGLWTPLHEAEASQNDTLVSRLYKLGAKSSVNKNGDTPEDIRSRLDAIDAW